MNVMIGTTTSTTGEAMPVFLDAEREAYYERAIAKAEAMVLGGSVAASGMEPPGAPAFFEASCSLSAFAKIAAGSFLPIPERIASLLASHAPVAAQAGSLADATFAAADAPSPAHGLACGSQEHTRGDLGTVGRGSEAPRRDGPIFEHFLESQIPTSFHLLKGVGEEIGQ